MKEEEEDLYNPKLQAVIEFLDLEDSDEIEAISEIGNIFTYKWNDYLVLDSREVDDYLEKLVDRKIDEITDIIYYDFEENLNYLKFYIKVDENAVRESIDLYSIGNGDWDEFNGYYIFSM